MADSPSLSGPPLTPAAFSILLALSDGDLHGYAIMQRVAQLTGGQTRLGPGTLYRSIRNLLAAGLIEEVGERPDPSVDDERRRYYRLTPVGRRMAEVETERLTELVEVARRSLFAPRRLHVGEGRR